MSLRQIGDSYFHLTYFSFPLLFFIYYYYFFFFKTLFFFCDPIRNPVRDPIRDPVRSDPDFVDAAILALSLLLRRGSQ